MKITFIKLLFQLKKNYNFSHYYYSGVIGSGTCIFSQTPLAEVFSHQYSLNGYPHKILHGDWWGGKGIAICKTVLHGIQLLIANTHVSFNYNMLLNLYF